MFKMFRYFSLTFSLLIHFVDASQRWHTSQHSLTQLYNLQVKHFNVINSYLNLETKRLEELKSNLAAMYKWKSYINNSGLNYHINNIQVMTHIYYQICKLEDLIRSEQSSEVIKTFDKHKDLSEEHILNAHRGLRRLQRFYIIPSSDMVTGRHNNRTIGDQMDACECFVMSKYCFEEFDMYGAIEWAIETYKKWNDYGQPKCVDIKKLNFYTSSLLYTGFDLTTQLNPNELHIFVDSEKFKRYCFLTNKDKNLLDSRKIKNTFDTYEWYYIFSSDIGEKKFRELCQFNAPIRILTKYSKCRYQAKNSPYRVLMPFKEEDINNDPNIKIYHDVLYDDEIAYFKKLGSENMKDAVILETSRSHSIIDEDRRSGQVRWLFNDDLSKTINARIEDFTGYSSKAAEKYQIVNYGLGGHCVPHSDSLGSQYKSKEFGDRLVTVLFNMNDVQNDGFTVFPFLNIICPAEKGAALVWINLNMFDGSKLMKTMHGACPILKGNKWIMTKWLLEEGQNLTYNWRSNITPS